MVYIKNSLWEREECAENGFINILFPKQYSTMLTPH